LSGDPSVAFQNKVVKNFKARHLSGLQDSGAQMSQVIYILVSTALLWCEIADEAE
jgi:hypothetical protein